MMIPFSNPHMNGALRCCVLVAALLVVTACDRPAEPFKAVDRFADSPPRFCTIHLGPHYLDPAVDSDFHSTLGRHEASPRFPSTSIAVSPDGGRFYFCTQTELLEFDHACRLLRSIPVSAFECGPSVVFWGCMRVVDDSLWFTVVQPPLTGGSSQIQGSLVRWPLSRPPAERILGPIVSGGWTVDVPGGRVFLPGPTPRIYDFTTGIEAPAPLPETTFLDFDPKHGLLASNYPDAEDDSIYLIDLGAQAAERIACGAWAFWGSDGFLYFVVNNRDLFRCRPDGSERQRLCRTPNKQYFPGLAQSADGNYLAFFYKYPQLRGTVGKGVFLFDLARQEFRHLPDSGFRPMVWTTGPIPETRPAIVPPKYLQPPIFMHLHDAVLDWPADDLPRLLDTATDLDAQDSTGRSALHYAAEIARSDVVKLLIDHGASPDFRNSSGSTPLHCVVRGPIYPPPARLVYSRPTRRRPPAPRPQRRPARRQQLRRDPS